MNKLQAADNPLAQEAFSKQSFVFDEIYAQNLIVAYKRERTRFALASLLKEGDRILELNAGTGQDALYFASKGYAVHATDISNGMLAKLQEKIAASPQAEKISTEQISFEALHQLANKGPYNAIFSNFGGLNCSKDLGPILKELNQLLVPGGVAVLVVMPGFCLWETILFFRGAFKLAFRRLFAKNGAKAHIEGVHFLCYYHHATTLIKAAAPDLELIDVEGLCTIVPPSYIENFPQKFPRSFAFLKKLEARWKRLYPFNRIGDYYIIRFQKRRL